MWTKSQNGENLKPADFERGENYVILRRNFKHIEATEEMPAHYEYEEWQMTVEQYEVHKYHEQIEEEQADALIELAELITEVAE
mgnify:CR=1 FL=1